LHIRVDAFEQQMRILESLAEVVSIKDLLTADPVNDRLVAVTFDDAYASALQLAVPICDSKNFPCCVFVAPALLGNVPIWDSFSAQGTWSDSRREEVLWRCAAKDQNMSTFEPELQELAIATLEELAASLRNFPQLSLGNHTNRHLNLGALTQAVVRAEVSEAHRWLESFAGERYEPILAYPFGIPPIQTPSSLHDWPVRYALLANGGWMPPKERFHPYRIPRWNVPAEISPHGFRARILGTMT
jgi:peptidoglycan/xylan/chitin deacetylase (PgdA/CDA1 family)